MQHHTGLSNSFWIYAVKAKLHTYNVTLKKRADYKTPTELCVETEYREMLFRLETERSDKELYQIIVQSRPVQMISY